MIHRLLPFVTLGLILSYALNAQHYKFEVMPAWVKPVDMPMESSLSKNEITSGYYAKLADYQINLELNATYHHEVVNIISYSGITSASQLSVTYDTSYQRLSIHHLFIWRKGVKLDRTRDLSLEILNNQDNLNKGIYDGRITAYDVLNDVRKDDLIDFAYTLTGDNPIFNNEKYLMLPLQGLNPIDLYFLRVLYKKDRDYSYRCSDGDSTQMTITESGGLREIEIRKEHVKAMHLEENMPAWTIPFAYFSLSSYKSWKDVNKWAQQVFQLGKEGDLSEVFEEIFKGGETTDEKINKIINYVQDDIRYMGIESGIGCIKPFPPEQVVKQRFGDCKDKSLLLVTLLNKIGVGNAYPALVNSALQGKTEAMYPNNQVFNHCIVAFDYENHRYWIDPTVALQGGDFRDIYTMDYGRTLVIGLPADSLTPMSTHPQKTGVDFSQEMTVSSFTAPATLTSISSRYGAEADNRRLVLEYVALNNLREEIIKDMKLLYPEVNETKEVIISDDVEKNTFTMTYQYEVGGFWKNSEEATNNSLSGYWMFQFEPMAVYQYLNKSTCEDRTYDFALMYPVNMTDKALFHLPGDLLIDDDYRKFENEAFFLEQKVEQLDPRTLQISYHYGTKDNVIKASDYKRICEEKNQMVKTLPIVIYFAK
jgi:hypothetical protein